MSIDKIALSQKYLNVAQILGNYTLLVHKILPLSPVVNTQFY